jgi:hypothetical protein
VAVVLPNENRDDRLQLIDRWDSFYADGAPATDTLVDRALMATVHHQRSVRYLNATLGRQVRGAVGHYHRVQKANVKRHVAELVKNLAAVEGLMRRCCWKGRS